MFTVADTTEVKDAAQQLHVVVTGVDLANVLPVDAKELIAVAEQIERTGRFLKLAATAAIEATAVWKGEGDRSFEDWMARHTGASKSQATQTVNTAKRLRRLPTVANAARAGQLSPEQTDAIADAANVDPSAHQRLLDAAKDRDVRDLKRECKKTKANADLDPNATRERIHAKRSCRSWTDEEGVGHLHLSGAPDEITRMDNAIRQNADRRFRAARRSGDRLPPDAYGFDAAVELLTSPGSGPATAKGSDAKIIVRVDYPTLLRGRCVDGETCEVVGMGPIPVSVVREWMDDAFLSVVITKGTEITKVVHLGRRFTAEQRTALQWQDPTCARRGCSNRLGLEYDHFEDWADTRTTRVQAGKRFCHSCHRLKTEGWDVSPPDEDGQCTFSSPRARDVQAELVQAIDLALANRRRGPPT